MAGWMGRDRAGALVRAPAACLVRALLWETKTAGEKGKASNCISP